MKISPTTAIESRGALLLIGMVAGFVLSLIFAYVLYFRVMHKLNYVKMIKDILMLNLTNVVPMCVNCWAFCDSFPVLLVHDNFWKTNIGRLVLTRALGYWSVSTVTQAWWRFWDIGQSVLSHKQVNAVKSCSMLARQPCHMDRLEILSRAYTFARWPIT